MRVFLCALLALGPATGALADVDGGTIETMLKGNRLGPMTPEEKEQALQKLARDKIDRTLGESKSARAAAGLSGLEVQSGHSPFDGNEDLPLGKIGVSRDEVKGTIIDEKTGKALKAPKVVEELQEQEDKEKEDGKAEILVGGACGGPPSSAINALQDLVKIKVEGGGADGADSDFFHFLYALFFLRRMRRDIPGVTSGQTVDARAIATFHNGNPGLMTFDCQKYTGLPATLQRKIACHEFYHKFNFSGGESPAYAIMSKC